jgi:hypothetical protein
MAKQRKREGAGEQIEARLGVEDDDQGQAVGQDARRDHAHGLTNVEDGTEGAEHAATHPVRGELLQLGRRSHHVRGARGPNRDEQAEIRVL